VYPWSPFGMQEKRIGPDLACACCLGNKSELQAALARIRHNLSGEAVCLERTFQILAYRLGMVVRSTAFTAVSRGVPLPFFFSYDMMTEHNGRFGSRHEVLEEYGLTVVEGIDGNGPDIAARQRINDGLYDVFTMGYHIVAVEVTMKRNILLIRS
jgi:hypothetical protein